MIQKIKSLEQLRAATRHNGREIRREMAGNGRIDPTRTHRNERISGQATSNAVMSYALQLFGDVDAVRKNAVWAVEVLFSLSPDAPIDSAAYFRACLSWTASWCGGAENVICADIHRDESAPHLHVLFVPLLRGRLRGGEVVGGPTELRALRQSFFARVASHFGLAPPPKPLGKSQRDGLARAVVAELVRTGDPALESVAWRAVMAGIFANPKPYAETLSVDAHHAATSMRRRQRSFVDIMTSVGRRTSQDREARR